MIPMPGRLLRDFRFALRSLRRTPVFALTAAAILGLGIGANAMVFSIVNAVVLRPLPFPDAGDIVQIKRRTPIGSSVSFPMHDYLALADVRGPVSASAILDVLAAGRYNLVTAEGAEPAAGLRVSARFFDVLGVAPARGRLFRDGDDGDDRPGGIPVAVITQGFWGRRFGADPAVIGRPLMIGDRAYTVIGIVSDAVRVFSPADIYLSLPVPEVSNDRTNSYRVIARVPPGTSRTQAEAQIDTVARREAQLHPSLTNMPQGVVLRSLHDELVAPIRAALQVLAGAVALVLLVACSNVANLVLARGLTRRREIAVMAALGASRWQIVERVVIENCVAAAAGGAFGLLVTWVAVRWLSVMSPANLPRGDRIGIDGWVLLFVSAASLASALLAGLPPALQLSRGDLAEWLKQGGERSGRGGHRLRAALTLAQVALSTMLLVGAGLLVRSFWMLSGVNPGFRADHLLTMSVSMTPSRYPDSARLGAYTSAVSKRLERIPGVVAASSTPALPSEFPIDFPVRAGGGPPDAAAGSAALDAWYRSIDPHYFAAMAIPLLGGRPFEESDSDAAAPVIIINRALARAAFPGGDALGRTLVIGEGYLTAARDLRPRIIVGIVGDTREQGLRFAPTLAMYVPVAQAPEMITRLVLDKIPVRWVVRTEGAPEDLVSAVRRAVLDIDPRQPAADFASMTDVLSRSIAPARFNMVMLTVFGMLALTLAAIGIYGLMAYGVAQRTREIGIRISLGAPPRQVVRELSLHGARLSAAGAIIGIAGALLLARFLRTMLFGVGAADALTMTVVAAIMTVVVLAATYLPASRAARVDPIVALRRE